MVGSVGGSLRVPDRFARRASEENGAAESQGKSLATPAVRRIAREAGIDINTVRGTGRGGRVTASDVQDFVTRGEGGSGRAETHAGPLTSTASSVPSRSRSAPPISFPTPISADGVAEQVHEHLAQTLREASLAAVEAPEGLVLPAGEHFGLALVFD